MMALFKDLAAVLATSVCMVALATPAQAQGRQFNVPAGSLKQALEAYAIQSGQQLIYRADEVSRARSPGARGLLRDDEALSRILNGTGFASRSDASGAIAIVQGGNAPAVAEATTETLGDSAASREAELDSDAEIVVTGTNFKGIAPVGSPLQTYRRTDIERSTAATTEDFIGKLPQNFSLVNGQSLLSSAGGNVEASANTGRGSAINLHGVGSGSTLTLLSGQRIAPSGTNAGFADVSLIPLVAIDRIEIVSDGASAIYGADAVAGVANVVLRRNFDGFESTFRYGKATRGGGKELQAAQVLGTTWATGSVMVAGEYYRQDSADTSQRSFLPQKVGIYELIPEQRRIGLAGTANLSLGEHTTLELTSLYGQRKYKQLYTSFGSLIDEHGKVKQYQASATIRREISDTWEADLTGSFSRSKMFADATFNGAPLPLVDIATSYYTIEGKADGTILSLPGGDAKLSLGASYRHETVDSFKPSVRAELQHFDRNRDVESAFAELYLPIVGRGQRVGAVDQLALSAALRHDRYSDFGSTTNPKLGVSWYPTSALELKGSFSTSFRAPPLPMLSPVHTYLALRLPNPDSPTGFTNTLIDGEPTNPDLSSESARSYSIGFAYTPTSVPDLSVSATLFSIKYKDRIATPPLVGTNAQIFFQQDVLSSFTTLNPPLSTVQSIFAESFVRNLCGCTAANIGAIFDKRPQNISRTETTGIDASVSYRLPVSFGSLSPFGSLTYLINNKRKATKTSPPIETVGTIFNAPSFRARAGIGLESGILNSTLSLSYVGSYDNNITSPISRVDAWTTVDWAVTLASPKDRRGPLGGWSASFTASNLFDNEPPFVNDATTFGSPLGYDPTNASAMGRTISIQLRKAW